MKGAKVDKGGATGMKGVGCNIRGRKGAGKDEEKEGGRKQGRMRRRREEGIREE